jgi:hypothetical protein
MSTNTKAGGIADLLGGEAAEAEAKRVAAGNGERETGYVHPSEHIDHDRLSIAEEGALEVSEHLERVSERERKQSGKAAATAAPARSRTATRPSRKKAAAKKTAARKAAPKKTTARKATPAKKVSAGRSTGANARTVAAEILKRRGGEMTVAELAALVVKSGRTKLAGKTPEATVAAQIYVAARNGTMFQKTSRGHVALLDAKAKATS